MSEDFNSLAYKLRMQRYDKETVYKLKTDAVNFERDKNKKKKAATKIQKYVRGSQSRQRFRGMMDEINTNIVIDYFRAKRKERIRTYPENIISFYLNRYLQRKRDTKRMILFDYFNYCTGIIQKIYQGFIFRKSFIPKFNTYRSKISKIFNLINSFKIRMILRSNKFQDVLVEISNIKVCLLTLMNDDRNSDKTEKLKRDFMKRLPKLQRNFYEDFYHIKNSKKWVHYPKVNKPWFSSYMNILSTLNLKPINIFDENPNILDNSPNLEIFIDNVKTNKDNFNSGENKTPKHEVIEIVELHQEFSQEILEREDYQDTSIVKQNNYFEEKTHYNKVENEDIPNNSEEINDKDDVDKILNDARFEYDDRPIKVNTQKINEFYKMVEEYRNEEENKAKIDTADLSPRKLINKDNKIKRKPPKYDARKAIEESKTINQNPSGTVNNDKTSFREFLKKIKEDSIPNKKADDGNINDNIIDANGDNKNLSAKKNSKKKKEHMPKEHYNTETGNIETISQEEFGSSNTLKNEEKIRRKKIVSSEISLRRKLHELEKSPPPRIDVKSIKSRIDCWSNENEPSNKKFKKSEIMIDTSTNKNNINNFMDKMLNEFDSVNVDLTDYLKRKAENMKDFSEIPFIKIDSFYIKHYSSEIYDV